MAQKFAYIFAFSCPFEENAPIFCSALKVLERLTGFQPFVVGLGFEHQSDSRAHPLNLCALLPSLSVQEALEIPPSFTTPPILTAQLSGSINWLPSRCLPGSTIYQLYDLRQAV